MTTNKTTALCTKATASRRFVCDGFVEFELENDPYSATFDDIGFDEINNEIDKANEDEEEYDDEEDEEEMEQTEIISNTES